MNVISCELCGRVVPEEEVDVCMDCGRCGCHECCDYSSGLCEDCLEKEVSGNADAS